jgi:hypothetical protein
VDDMVAARMERQAVLEHGYHLAGGVGAVCLLAGAVVAPGGFR